MGKTLGYGEITVANMTEPFTVMLTNEAQQFATDSNRKVTSAQSYYTDIIVIRGSQERTDYTIGNITSGSGITVSKNSKRVAFSVSAGTTIGADAGVIEIPITLDGQTVKKQFSWSCGKQGPQGVKGEDGSNFAWNLLKGTGTAKEFTPKGNLTNQTTLFNKLDLSGQTLKEGDKFVISCDLEWTQFTQGTSGTFDYWFQGSVDYSWSYDNIFTQGLQKVQPTKAEILASDGKKHLSAVCTMKQSLLDKKIFEIGIRFDNTDGTGKIKISNLKIAKEDKESPWCLHPDELKGATGDKGKSVQSVIEYYLATSASTGVTTSTSGWSTDPTTQKLTAEKKYLWNCKQTVYDDGTRGSITSPVICGTYGDKGNDGQTSYVHTAYANITFVCKEHQSFTLTESTLLRYGKNGKWVYKIFAAGTYNATTGVFGGNDPATGLAKEVDKITDFSATDTTGRLYTGQYSDFTETASTDPSKYNWAKTTGDNGISPKVSLSKSGNTTTISIVDATGTHTQTVKDGTNGTPGATGKDGKTSYFHVKYSNDGGKTFTGNSGEDTGIYMGNYTDYTEADSTDVKKYTWIKVKGDKGDTGQKGQDGTSIKITSKSVTYQASTSGTTAPTGTWSTTVPTVNNGQYLWTKTTVQYSDGNKTEAYSVAYKGTNGTNGTSVAVSKTEVTYQVSASGTTAPTGTWSTTMPSCDQGQYLWTKTYVKYSDGKDTTSYSVSYKGVDGEKFSWNALIGSSFLYNSLPNNVNFSMVTVNNVSATAFTTNGLHYKATASNGAPNSSRGVKINSSVLDLKVGDTVTFSCDVKGTFGTKNNGLCLMHATTSNNNSWAAVHNGLKYSTSIPDWTRKSTTHIIPSNIKIESDGSFYLYFYFGGGTGSEVDVYVRNIQLEKGSAASPWAPHPKDLEGRGVFQTVQYYLATSQASGVTSSTSGWSTDITTQKLTADKKYLWNCYQTKYSDGTSEPISTPKVIGVYGDKGQNAKNLTITPSSQYFKSTDGGKTFAPNTITIKPTIQGEISFGKWQYSIDGGVSFADVVSGQTGLTINNNVLTVSKDSSLYSDDVTMVTFRAVANDSSFYDTCSIAKIYDVNDIGDGRNLLLNTSSYRESNPLERTGSKTDDYSTYPKIITSIDLSANQKYTLQAKTDSNWATKHDTGGHAPSEKLVGLWLVSDDTNTFLDMSKGYAVFTAPKTTKYKLRVNQYSDGTNSYTIRLWDIKLEKGQSASGWSPAPEDVQTAILSTKSEISDVSLKVDKNKQAIEQRVEKTTYQQDLNLVKGDISKANEGLNKWRYEIYPKSLFASEYQGKSTMDVFAKNTNLTPSQSVLINDTDLSIAWNYDNNYIGYALTFAKFSAAKSVAITFAHDDGAHIYLNGKLIGGNDVYNNKGESLTLGFVKGWNCIEVVVNEGGSTEGFTLGTTISALSECQLMNCYYGTPVARQSHITNQLVQNTTDIKGISTKVSKVTSVIGDNGENFTSFKNDYSDFKQTMNGFKTTVGQTYVTKDDFNGLEIGGRNLLLYSQTIRAHNDYYNVGWLTDEVETFNGCPVWSVKNQCGKLGCLFKSHVIDRGLVKVGDTLTYSLYAKTNNASGKNINCSYRFKGDGNAYWFNGSGFNVGTSWTRYSVTFTVTKDMLATDTYMNEIGFEETASMSGDDKVYYTCPKLERGTKATDYTPAPEDNEINGQNLASNLPSNWEQGSINYTANLAYGSLKSTLVSRLRTKDVFPVSGNITISAGTSTNSSKEELNFYYVLFDINKKSISHGDTWQSLTSPKIINCGDAKYMAIILRWGSGSTAITPSDISQICLKIERGTSATPFTLAPEDVNGKIVNVETIANQTANKFEWIVKGGDKSSSMVLTDDFLNIVANNINLTGKVTFNSLSSDAKNEIGKVAQSKVDDLQIGGRNLLVQKNITEGYLSTDGKGSFVGSGGGDQTSDWIDVSGNKYITVTLYEDFTNTNNSGRYCEYDADKNCISTIDYNPRQKSSVIIELKSNTKYIRVTAIECKTRRYKIEAGNKATDWTPAPEDYLPQVDLVSNWTTNTTWIDGGKIYTGSITADKIAANAITADKIATDAIKSRNYISSGGTQGSFLNLSDGSFTSPNLSWDSNGNLIAKNANLSGEITATNGSIGKYKITDQWLITGSGSTATGIGGNQAFWAGAEDSNSAPFRVGYDGKLYANGATISGDITATTGKIGDLTLKDGILTGTGSYSEPYTEDDDGTVTSTITTNYITKLFGKGLTIDSTVKYSDEDDVYSYKVSVLPDEISFTDGEEIGMLGAGGLQILQVNDNSDSYSSEANEVSLSSGASNFYYTTPVNQTTDKYLHVCFSADGASFMASQGDKFNSFDIGYSSAKYSGNFAANKFVYTGNSLNYVECLEANDTTNVYFHSSGYYSFRVNNEGNWSNETQSVYITERGISVPGKIGLYSQEMSNYVARYYVAGSTKSTAIGNNSYQTRIYGSSVWANKAVSTSDVRLKQDFQSLDKFEDLYMQLQPVSFKYIDGYDKSEDRYFGLKAQPTEKLFEDMGENPDDYAMFNKFGIDHEDIKERIGYDVDFDEEHGLDYTNLITLNTHMVQKTRRELAELQKENAELKDMLKTIVKKINM